MGGSTPKPECTTPADCTMQPEDSFCGARTCQEGKCGFMMAQAAGTPLPSQKYGDCQEVQCGADGKVVTVDKDDDAFNDGNDCTTDGCNKGVATHDPVAQGVACEGGICDGQGACVQCIDMVLSCPAMKTCAMGKCIGALCGNGKKDSGEGDIDCGGSCLLCADGKTCSAGTQCASQVCTGGMCVMATCSDQVKNGTETAADCGGSECQPCPDDRACKKDTDCQSGVCSNAYCAAPTCTDGVQNDKEMGVDCGGNCPNPCAKP